MGVKAGDLVLYVPNQFTKQQPFPTLISKRVNPIIIRHSISKIDTIWYSLPEGFALNGKHLNEKINSEFGTYLAETTSVEGKIKYIRNLTLNKGLYASELYENLHDFYDKISAADNKKLALKKLN